MTAAAPDMLRRLGALATIVVGVVHLQQYADSLSDVPTIGVLFLLNAAGAGVVAVLLATRRAAPLGALAGIALSAAAIVSVLISMTDGGLFDYTEPTFRTAVVVAVVFEAAAVLLLLAYLLARRAAAGTRAQAGPPMSPGTPRAPSTPPAR